VIMAQQLNATDRKSIADEVRRALAAYQPRRYVISVNDDGILQDDDWYHVLVTTPNHERDRDFYDALVKAEADLEQQAGGKAHYLLVPVLG
jgi:hypothetical protein